MSTVSLSEYQEKLVTRNIKLAYCIAFKFLKDEKYRIYKEDFISCALIALVKASKTFDESKNIKFSTYAAKCMENEILMFIRKFKNSMSDISLSYPINSEDDTLTLGDIIRDERIDIERSYYDYRCITDLISIAINVLSKNKLIIFMYYLAGVKQSKVAIISGFSQANVSRLLKKARKQVEIYYKNDLEYKEVFRVDSNHNGYQLIFSITDSNGFAMALCEIGKKFKDNDELLMPFAINCKADKVIIRLPATEKAFAIIAEFVTIIKEYTLVCKKSSDSSHK